MAKRSKKITFYHSYECEKLTGTVKEMFTIDGMNFRAVQDKKYTYIARFGVVLYMRERSILKFEEAVQQFKDAYKSTKQSKETVRNFTEKALRNIRVKLWDIEQEEKLNS